MSETAAFKPYSSLPEPFVLVAAAVWVDLLAAAWPVMSTPGLLVRALVYGMLLAVAAGHSWLFARGTLVSGGAQRTAVSIGWLILLVLIVGWLEAGSSAPLIGVLVFMQVAQCSFVFNHATLRLTHLAAFCAMLVVTLRLTLVTGGVAWLVFAVVSMLVLAYGRTASKAGPASYDLGERRGGARLLTLVSVVGLLAAVLFLVTPLVRWPDVPKPGASFHDRVFEGSRPQPIGNDPFGINGSTTFDERNAPLDVMVVDTKPAVSGPLYLRGETFDAFDGRDWTSTGRQLDSVNVSNGYWTALPFPVPDEPRSSFIQITQTYTMLVNVRGVVFSACRPTQIQFPDGGADTLRFDEADHSMRVDGNIAASKRYVVDGIQESFTDAVFAKTADTRGAVDERYLQIPDGIDDAVRALAVQKTAGYATDYERAVALERYLHGRDFFYSLDGGVDGSQVVNDFLLTKRRGHCALFASSMVVMARSLGIPARYVTGFLAQDRSPDGFHVRGSDAHAWVEVYVGAAGWIAFDPTSGRTDPEDGRTRRIARAGNHDDTRTDGRIERGGGLYGRDGHDFSPSGGDNASDGRGSSGTNPDLARNDERGGSTGDPASGDRGGDARGDAGGRGGVDRSGDGSDAPNGAGTTNGSGATGGSGTSAGAAHDPSNGDARTAGTSTPDPTRTVVPPGGSTTPPPTGSDAGGGKPGGGDGGSRPTGSSPPHPSGPVQSTPAPPRPQTPEEIAGEWRLFVTILLLVGAASLILLVIWQRAARRVVEKKTIRAALPLVVSEDPDPRRFIVALYHTMVDGLSRVGLTRRVAEAPADFAAKVERKNQKLGEPVSEITELFHVARYTDDPMTTAQAASARAAWNRLARSVTSVAKDGDDESLERANP